MMLKFIGFLLSALMFAACILDVQSVQILDIAECRTCFAALAPGCKEKMSSADSNSNAGAIAMKDCMCTKQYFNTFAACGTCSAKSMNSNAVPDQTALDGLRQSCTSIGANIEQNSASTPGTMNNGGPSPNTGIGNNGQGQNGMSNSNNGRSAGSSNFANYKSLFVVLSFIMVVNFY